MTAACLLMQVPLICHQEVQRVLEFEKGVEVVVAKQDRQLARLQTLQHSDETLRHQAPDYIQTAYSPASCTYCEVQHALLYARCQRQQMSGDYWETASALRRGKHFKGKYLRLHT